MAKTSKDKDQEKGDEVLRRLLKTPPKHHEKGEASSKREPKPNHERREKKAKD